MIDITDAQQGQDMEVFPTETPRAANILAVQIGSLEYAQLMGIDLNYFLQPDFKFQNESFKTYLVETLANWGINVLSVVVKNLPLASNFVFNLNAEETNSGMIAR